MKKLKFLLAVALCAITGTVFAEVKISELTGNAKETKYALGGKRVDKYTVGSLPEELKDLQLVYVPRGNSQKSGISFSFKVDSPVTIYLLVDKRFEKKINFEGWKKTDMKATWLVGKAKYKDVIYVKDFPTGEIKIPANPKHCIPHSALIKKK